jgi:hypothetical protein
MGLFRDREERAAIGRRLAELPPNRAVYEVIDIVSRLVLGAP